MTWTPDRPTKPGKYWLSIGIDHREKFASDVCREPHHVYLLDIFEEGGGLWLDGVVEVGHCLPASALFNRYVEPADPHAQPVLSLRSRIEALPDLVLGSGRVIGGAVDRGAVLALLESEGM